MTWEEVTCTELSYSRFSKLGLLYARSLKQVADGHGECNEGRKGKERRMCDAPLWRQACAVQLRRLALRLLVLAPGDLDGGIQLTGLGSRDHRIQHGGQLGPVVHGNRPPRSGMGATSLPWLSMS